MTVTFDLNVLVDVFARRSEYFGDSRRVVTLVRKNQLSGVVPVHGLTTIYYLLARLENRRKAELAVDFLLRRFEIGLAERKHVIAARASSIVDLEDALVEQTALESGSVYIISRDVEGFRNSRVPALSPTEFAALFRPRH